MQQQVQELMAEVVAEGQVRNLDDVKIALFPIATEFYYNSLMSRGADVGNIMPALLESIQKMPIRLYEAASSAVDCTRRLPRW
jgi:hypothetical protein